MGFLTLSVTIAVLSCPFNEDIKIFVLTEKAHSLGCKNCSTLRGGLKNAAVFIFKGYCQANYIKICPPIFTKLAEMVKMVALRAKIIAVK